MKITLQQVEVLRHRVKCDYQQGEKALRKTKGNIDDAVLYIKKKQTNKSFRIISEIENIVNKILSYNLVINNGEKSIFKFPIFLLILGVWILNIQVHFLIVIAVVAAFSNLSFEIYVNEKDNYYEPKVNNIKDNHKRDTMNKESQEKNNDNEKGTKYNNSKKEDEKSYEDTEEFSKGFDEDDFNEIVIE